MSILRFSYARSFRLMAVAFFVGLGIDACNIADLFIGHSFDVRHDDIAVDLHMPPISSRMPSAQTGLSGLRSMSRVRVIYDEDSPLTEIRHEASFLSAPLVLNESRIQLLSPHIADELYLRNSTLLI